MSGKQIFHAKRNTGTKEQPNWQFLGTVVIRENGRSGVLFLRTGQKGPDGKAVDEQIALFAKREKDQAKGGDAAAPAAA